MKVVIIFVSLFSSATYAQLNYRPMVDCGNRALVVDKASETTAVDRGGRTETRNYYQLVLKDKEVIRDFIAKGAINPNEVNNKGEVILHLNQETYSNTKFYGVSAGNVTTVKVLAEASIEIKTFSSPSYGSMELANFIFNDCKLQN